MWIVFPSFPHFPSEFWFSAPQFFRVLCILGILSICDICCKDFLWVFQLSLTLLVVFYHSNDFKKLYVAKFIFFKLLLIRRLLPMQKLSGIQLWFLLLYAWFIYFMWVPDMVRIYPSAQRYNIVFFQITNHLFQSSLLNILFLSQWFEMLPLWYTKFSFIFGIVFGLSILFY